MQDEEFTNIVRSGAKHSVKVSERTGNAKTPKNIVNSEADEDLESKKALLAQHVLALESAKAKEKEAKLALDLNSKADTAPAKPDTALAPTSVGVPNVQTLANGGKPSANVQQVLADKIQSNVQQVTTEVVSTANIQSVPVDQLTNNVQKVSTASQTNNQQKLVIDAPPSSDNVQNIAIDKLKDNVQSVLVDQIDDNTQKLAVSASNENRLAIDTDAAAPPNVQSIPTGQASDNVQSINATLAETNTQSITDDTLPQNVQTLAIDEAVSNRQTLDQTPGLPANRATIDTPVDTDNRQAVAAIKVIDNIQTIGNAAVADNVQDLDKKGVIHNRQVTPQNPTPGLNQQGVPIDRIQTHLEALPDTQVERRTVAFPSSDSTPATPKPAAALKPSVTARAPLSNAELTKIKQEEARAAFRGRLAGIKNTVDSINSRLTDIEEDVKKTPKPRGEKFIDNESAEKFNNDEN
jgi:hypothetical protein